MSLNNIQRTDAYDFVVCGGGPSGVCAAVSAARKGLRTALIEGEGALGGAATLGGVGILLGGRKLNENTGEHVRVIGGLFDEITDTLIAQGKAIEPNTTNLDFNPIGWYPRMASGVVVDDTALKILLDELCEKSGVRVYFFTRLIAAERREDRIESILVSNKDGIVRITAPLFADCTGDADLAAYGGCKCFLGREEDKLTAPASIIFHVEEVDGNEYVRYQNEHQSPKLAEIIEKLKKSGEWPYPYEIFIAMQLVEKDVFLVNTIRQIKICGTSEGSVTKALMQGRKESVELFEIMKNHFPGFKNARIRKICDWAGIRESRRIAGRHVITLKDALGGAKYPDTVAATTYNFDLPDPLRPSFDPMMGDGKNSNPKREHVVIRIPYRSLLPAEVNNLIVAGRCISAEREVLGAARLMGICMQTGQAAGTAAALCHKGQTDFQGINIPMLRETLWLDKILNPDHLPFS
jgi:hypothetical protein